jgi:general secretion pathway protein J
MKRTYHDAGFTLVEVLVALSILSLLLAGLASSLHYTQYIFRLSDDNARRVEEISILRKVMLEWVSQVNALGDAQRTIIVGDRQNITILAAPPRIFAEASPLVMTLSPDSGSRGLLASWRKEPDTGAITRRLLSADYVASFSFYGGPLGWQDHWGDRDAPPALVKLQLRENNHGYKTEMIVPVRSARGPSCVSPPAEKACLERQ